MIIEQIKPLNKAAITAAKVHLDNIAKPLGGLGIFENYILQIAGITGKVPPEKLKKCVAVFCSDNGIVSEGVTQTASEVTAIVARNITLGHASVSNMACITNADVFAYDVGMLTEVAGVINKKITCGSKNFAIEPAMCRIQAETMIKNGIEIVRELKDKGYNIIASGEMGIGNTTTSSAVTSVLLNVSPQTVTGKGAGLSKEGISHKAKVIFDAIALHKPNAKDPLDVLSKVGGFDIAAMCGLFLGGAIYRVPIIIDGYISSVAALLAYRLFPDCKDYMLASHASAEPGAKMVLNSLKLNAPLHAQMALGEGTGAVSILPILDMAYAVYQNMPTFEQINIEEYKAL